MDMNMVLAGVVSHPEQWPFCGYHEIQRPRQRYSLIDYKNLMELLGIDTMDELKTSHRGWIEESIESHNPIRESKWTESIAIGSKFFVEDTKKRLDIRGKGRTILGNDGVYELREPQSPYKANFTNENSVLRNENTYYWDIYHEKTKS